MVLISTFRQLVCEDRPSLAGTESGVLKPLRSRFLSLEEHRDGIPNVISDPPHYHPDARSYNVEATETNREPTKPDMLWRHVLLVAVLTLSDFLAGCEVLKGGRHDQSKPFNRLALLKNRTSGQTPSPSCPPTSPIPSRPSSLTPAMSFKVAGERIRLRCCWESRC
jgi:hypothetical protein